MKYIIFKSEDLAQEFPVIFPNVFIHEAIAKSILNSLFLPAKDLIPVSAGEINLVSAEFECAGKSDSLNLKSRPQDTLIIQTHDYMHGIL